MSEISFDTIFDDLKRYGNFSSPRGMKILEIENYNYILSPRERWCNFPSRKLNINYTKKELLWYLKGDKYDISICEHAKMWKELINSDGSINSNYGQYIFGEQNQFMNVINTLKSDKDSRRASIIILNPNHLFMETKDLPCTYSLNFRIRENRLNMSVRMRSQDAVFGMGNDAAIFSIIQEMVYNKLLETYKELELGKYHHCADSFHIYERHFEMLDKILEEENIEVDCPHINGPEEVDFLLKNDFSYIPEMFKFSLWLVNNC